MNDDRIDFSQLDPTKDGERFDHIVRSIMVAAEPELTARRARASVIGQVGLWWRPLLAAAAIAAIIAVGALTRIGDSEFQLEDEIGLAEAMGVPQQVAEWARSDEVPTTEELFMALEEDS